MDLDGAWVLVVEDDAALAKSVGEILRIHGYASREVHTGGKGLELIGGDSGSPAVALVDLGLPDMNGMDLVGRLADAGAPTEVVILTGNASLDSAVDALRRRSYDYLVKPVAPEELVSTVGRGVRRWKQRRAEEELRRDRERFQQVIEALSDVVLLLAADGSIQYQSPSAAWVLGHGDAGAIGSRLIDHVTEADRPAVLAALDAARRPPSDADAFEFRLLRSDGTVRFLEALARPLQGSVNTSLVVTCRDITERRRLEQELRQTQKLDGIGRLAGGIAHDFNNQLSAILTSVELAGWEPDLPPRVAEELDVIRAASDRAASLTRQLLIFSRKDIGEAGRVDVEERVADMVEMLRRLIPETIELTTRYGEHLPEILIDPTQLEQTIMNLVVNARDALPRGGTIVIDVVERVHTEEGPTSEIAPGRYVEIAVTDDGVGMSEDVASRVFEPFFTTKAAGHGTGLGLATCYGIVTGVGGHIGVETRVGEGTTVRVLLPAASPVDKEEAPAIRDSSPTALPRGEGVLLFVEDDAAVREGTRRLLARLGYTVHAASGGAEALEVARNVGNAIDLVLTDLIMPDMTGPEVVTAVRELIPGMPALYISGYADEAVLNRLDDPDAQILKKPIRVKQLHQRIQEALGTSAAPESTSR